jgi:hypothetical protein
VEKRAIRITLLDYGSTAGIEAYHSCREAVLAMVVCVQSESLHTPSAVVLGSSDSAEGRGPRGPGLCQVLLLLADIQAGKQSARGTCLHVVQQMKGLLRLAPKFAYTLFLRFTVSQIINHPYAFAQ